MPVRLVTDDRLWSESHQAQHVLKRDHGVSGFTGDELQRARRELEASPALARPGSVTGVPIMARLRAIDAEFAERSKGSTGGRG